MISERFKEGSKLTLEEKSKVLSGLKDSYKVMNRPFDIDESFDRPKKIWLGNSSDYMIESDITGRKLRWHIHLPSGKIAHPTEIYHNISINDIKNAQSNIERFSESADYRYNKVVKQIESFNQTKFVAEQIKIALEHGATFEYSYDSNDKGKNNPNVVLKFVHGGVLSVPEYILQRDLTYLKFTKQDLIEFRIGTRNEWLHFNCSEINWEKFYNKNK